MQNEIILCGASAYTKRYYLNPDFDKVPESIQEELKVICVLFTEEVGGTLQLVFDDEGTLEFRTDLEEGDFSYDEIGGILKVKQLQQAKQELFEALEMYYKVFFLGMPMEEDE
jgi:hypothetical protein